MKTTTDIHGTEDVAHALADLQVQDLEGRPVALKDTWAHGPIVLAFVRHFG